MLGKPVPDFSLRSTGGNPFRLSALRGTKLVLYFYPKDDTPGCTQQGADFRDRYGDFKCAGCEIYGVSRHPPKSRESFKAKLKNMYGKKVRGIERSTFVIDEKAMRAREWRGVKVPGHVEEVLSFVKAL